MTPLDGDKRWTAILSTDMVDFTAVSGRVGPEAMYELLGHVLGLARECIEAEGGHVVDTAGDGILAAFGAPRALENAPLQSCRAAIAFHGRIAAAGEDLQRRFGVRPRFRTGIGGGNMMIVRQEGGAIRVVGDPVNKAARLQALAEPGGIVISETIRREAEGHVRTTARGVVDLKGFPHPVEIHFLDGLVDTLSNFEGVTRRGLIDLVSREAELDRAGALLQSGGANRMVVITGAPGIGKSRLAHEIVTKLAGRRPAYIGQCAPSGQATAYGPFFDMLRQAADAPRASGRAEVFERLFGRFPHLADETAAEQLLDVTRQERDQTGRALKTRSYLLSLLQGLSEAEDCVFVIEDGHWLDTASNALLSLVAGSPVPFLVTCRPGFRADWFDAPASVLIPLSPLEGRDIRRLAEANLAAAVSDDLARLISDKSEGNPLMAEEIIRALRREGRLTEGPMGLEVAGGGGSLLTGNLEQLVLSRVDKLEPEQKTALQYASAIGRDFPEDLLTGALGRSAGLPEIAREPGLIERVDGGQWRFAHALIRDAVYASILTEQRQSAHLRIAETLEASAGAGFEGWSILAEHFLRSRNADRSVPYLIRAAEQSLNVYALYDVDQLLEQAQQLLETDPGLISDESYRDLAVCWLRALHQIGDFGRMRKVSSRVLPRLEHAGYSPALSIGRTLTAIAMAHSRDYEAGRDLALRSLADAEAQRDNWGAAWAKVALMRIYDETKWEPLETIRRYAVEIEPVADETGDRHLAMTALYLLSSSYRMAGHRDVALQLADRIEVFAVTHSDRRARVYSVWARALVYCVEGNAEEALALIRTAREDAIPGSGDQRVCIGIELFAETFMRSPDEVRQSVHNLVGEARALQDMNIAHGMQWTLAILELRAGNIALGWRLLTALLAEAETAGNINILSQVIMTRAEFMLAVSGLVDSRAERIGSGAAFTLKRPGLADIVTGLRLRPRSRMAAQRTFERYLSLTGVLSGPQYARCQIGLGIIAAARGDKGKAAQMCGEGRRIAERDRCDQLVARADRAFSRYGLSRTGHDGAA